MISYVNVHFYLICCFVVVSQLILGIYVYTTTLQINNPVCQKVAGGGD